MRLSTTTVTLAVAAACCIGLAAAQDSKTKQGTDTKAPAVNPADPNDPTMKAWQEAATPGKMHAWLCKDAGAWTGTSTMWMMPDAPPTVSECTMVTTPIFGGRYLKQEFRCEMPDFGKFEGFSIVGYDNAAKQFQMTWADNMGTGMMTSVGQLSSDEKTLSWDCSFYCPMAQKKCSMREVVTRTGEGTQTFDMYSTDPASGKEFKCMHIDLKRASKAAATTASTQN